MSIVMRIVRLLAVVYLIFLGILVWMEDSMVFQAPSSSRGNWNPAAHHAEETQVPSADDFQLDTWIIRHPSPKAVLIYCHGNAETLGLIGPELGEMSKQWQVTVVSYDYHGYGKTGGKPSERAILKDALAIGDWSRKQEFARGLPIIAFGRSLGGASAVEMAANGQVDALILDRTFSATVDVAAYRYPIVPVRWLMKNQFRSIEKIGLYQGPLLQFHGDVDEVVPYRFGKKLFEASTSENKEFVTIPGLYHNDPFPDACVEKVKAFIPSIRKAE